MDYREEYDQTIDLRDMLFHILYRWRSVAAAALIAVVLAAGYVAIYNGTVLPKERFQVQAPLQTKEQEKAETQAQAAEGQPTGRSAEEIQKEIDQLQSQLDELKEHSFFRFCAVGFLAGGVVIILCYGISYVISGKMRGEREILDNYGYRLLGVFPRRRKKKPLSGLDRLIEKKEGVSGEITEEEAYRIVSVNVANFTVNGGLFLVTGTVELKKLEKLVEKIVPQLQEDAALMTGADMNVTAGTLEMLAECDGVILVEERNESLRAKVRREHESIAALGKPVVGYVLM